MAHVAHEVLDELGAIGWPKTSGGKGMHIYVRIHPTHGFKDVRRAALAFAREVERRAPDDVTTTWWRKDRDPTMLFVDYNQNARDHTIAVGVLRARQPRGHRVDADRVGRGRRRPARATSPSPPSQPGTPRWATCTPGIDDAVFDLAALLEWADRDERAGAEGPVDPDEGPDSGADSDN